LPPTVVAEWAGHSVEVLLKIYAKCLDRSDALIRARVQAALGCPVPGTLSGELPGVNGKAPLPPGNGAEAS